MAAGSVNIMVWWVTAAAAAALLQVPLLVSSEVDLVHFLEAPREAEPQIGGTVLIQCETTTAVVECQWLWKSLKDVNNPAVVVSTFPAYGNDSRDCSVRFKNVHVEQEGLWICGVRKNNFDDFTLGPPFKLEIFKPTTPTRPPPRPVQFAEITHDNEVKLGMPMHLICKTVDPVEECIWTWRANVTENEPEVPVKRVDPFGDERRNCDMRLDHAMLEHDGLWTCGAKRAGDERFTISRPIRVTILEVVEFVQLSQDIQVAIGEPVLLRCITNIRVENCRWLWQPIGKMNNTAEIVKKFTSYGDYGRDCSVRLKSVDEDQEGYWKCQVQVSEGSEFMTAPPAKLTVLYPVKVKFMQQPEPTRVARGEDVFLYCITSLTMEVCTWTWQPRNNSNAKPALLKSFPPFGNYSRDCSVKFRNVLKEQEGFWGCSVSGQNTTLNAPPILLSVFEPVPIGFIQLSKDIHIPPGSPFSLRCMTKEAVAECRWTWQAFNDTTSTEKVIKQFPPSHEGRDCSVRFSSAEEGMWTCSARNHGESRYTSAPSATLHLLQPESVTVALWASHDSNVSLACRLSSPVAEAVCQWHQPPHQPMAEGNHSSRFWVYHDRSSGVCTLSFIPQRRDLGQWTCSFHVETPEGAWEVASSNLILLDTPTTGFAVSEEQLGWLVGILALLVVVLTATLVAISVCKWRKVSTDPCSSLANAKQRDQEKKDISRYTDSPTKIDFQFRETLSRSVPDRDVAILPEPSRHQHIYERVDRLGLITPLAGKGLYENVE